MIFGKGRWDMGLRDKYAKKIAEQGFKPLDLTEENVQAIFERCLAKKDCKNRTTARLFFERLGYSEKDSIVIDFDGDVVAQNKKSIMYLYGQLDCVHSEKHLSERQSMSDFAKTYAGKTWAQSKAVLLELLYLGGSHEAPYVTPFDKRLNDTVRIASEIKPTLSPKDPAFPAWWEQHKAEWED